MRDNHTSYFRWEGIYERIILEGEVRSARAARRSKNSEISLLSCQEKNNKNTIISDSTSRVGPSFHFVVHAGELQIRHMQAKP